MVDIVIKKGLDVPIEGRGSGEIKDLQTAELKTATSLKHLALDVSCFENTRFRLKKKIGERVLAGEALLEDKGCEGRVFVSPASGTLKEIRRGLKRRLLQIVVEVDEEEKYLSFPQLHPNLPRQQLIEGMLEGGIFPRIRRRPFNLLADPKQMPRSIFVKAIESAPFHIPSELQVKGWEQEFQTGLDILAKLTEGRVHLVHHKKSDCQAFTGAQSVEKHSFSGPHPISHPSLHIHFIDPIQNYEDSVWTLEVYDVLCLGYLFTHQKVFTEKLIGLMGPGVIPEKRGVFRGRQGFGIQRLCSGATRGKVRYISGDVLSGQRVEADGYLGFYDSVICLLPENTQREFLHFFRPGFGKFSATKAYVSSWIQGLRKYYPFTTNQHGEKRAFIDANIYDQVMPMNIPVVPLVKAVMTRDFELAEELGLLEVVGEDFSLPTFICPSKNEMSDVIHQGLQQYAQEVMS